MQETFSEEIMPASEEYYILQEWEAIQRELLRFALVDASAQGFSWRDALDWHIRQSTRDQACMYWDPLALGDAAGYDRFCEVRHQNVRYGFLGLMPGYLSSRAFPDLPQSFAHLCALLIAFAEHQAFVQYQTDYLPTPLPGEHIGKLTRRESEVLLGLMRGESDPAMAERLGIEATTVHTHRKRLYRRLGVHSTQEATLRCFTHRLVDWLANPGMHSEHTASGKRMAQEGLPSFSEREQKAHSWSQRQPTQRAKLLSREDLAVIHAEKRFYSTSRNGGK